MATPDPSEPKPSSAATALPPEDATVPVEPAPEPWTPERALKEYRTYDRYIVGGVVLLAFFAAAHKVTNSTLWPLLKAGEVMIETKSLLNTDVFSFTEEGTRWVNIPWLYELGSYLVYSLGAKFAAKDAEFAQQIGAGLLVGMNALVRALTVLLLLRLRKPGPGLWWFCVVACVAMGTIVSPRLASFELTPGGIARQPAVMPETWGVLFLAIEILALQAAFRGGRPRALFGLLPLFLLWANVDESFVIGLILLVAASLGFSLKLKGRATKSQGTMSPVVPSTAISLGVAAGCFAICLLNPSLFRIYPTALEPFLDLPRVLFQGSVPGFQVDQLSFFGHESFRMLEANDGAASPLNRLFYYLALVAIGLFSFVMNAKRLDLGRLAIFVAASLLWGCLSRLSAEFAVIFIYAVGLNGQEWYQDRFGVLGRTSSAWSVWSVGGRALTILVVFLAMAKVLTGYGYDMSTYPRVMPPFGFGASSSEFDFEGADFVKLANLSGKVMNLGPNQGDALIWRAYPEKKSFIDRRKGVFGSQIRADLIAFRQAFPVDESDKTVTRFKSLQDQWKPILDKYGASAVMLDPSELFYVYEGLRTDTAHFIPIFFDGRTAIFGRKDASAADLKFFEESRLDAPEQVFKRVQNVPAPDRGPTPMTFLDRIVRNRALVPPQSHVYAAATWLNPSENAPRDGLTDAANCIMAIRECRIALHHNPDDSSAYIFLSKAYERLLEDESISFRSRGQSVPMDFLQFRLRQRLTALNFAIQTTPPPRTQEERQSLVPLYLELSRLYRDNNILDMEYDALATAKDMMAPEPLDLEYQNRMVQLDDAIGRFKDQLLQMTTDRNADPQQRARQAVLAGFLGIAIHELEEAEGQGVSADAVLSALVDLYCRTGQPEKANDKIAMKTGDDPALSDGPGTAGTSAHRQGLVALLLGYYDTAIFFWQDQSIRQIRQAETQRALTIGKELMIGQARAAVGTLFELTGLPNSPGFVENQCNWEWELGIALLEAGKPKEAGAHFVAAIEVNPQTPMRPLLVDYLKKLDIPLPQFAADPTPSPTPSPGVKLEK